MFDNVRKGEGKGFLNLNKDTSVWIDNQKSKWCISKDCNGDNEIKLKEIMGETTQKKK